MKTLYNNLDTEAMILQNSDYTVYYDLVKPIKYLIFYYIAAGILVFTTIASLICFLVTRKNNYINIVIKKRGGKNMLISTTSSLEGKTIIEYRGIVFGEVINGVNFVKDFTAGITDFIGGRSEIYERELIDSRADAIKEMINRAEKVGANAIIGVKIDYETIGQSSSMLAVIASGTAVVIE